MNFKILVKIELTFLLIFVICAIAFIIVALIYFAINLMGYYDLAISFSVIILIILYFIIFLRYSSVFAVIVYTKCSILESLTISTNVFKNNKSRLFYIIIFAFILSIVAACINMLFDPNYFKDLISGSLDMSSNRIRIGNILSSTITILGNIIVLVATLFNVKYVSEVEKVKLLEFDDL